MGWSSNLIATVSSYFGIGSASSQVRLVNNSGDLSIENSSGTKKNIFAKLFKIFDTTHSVSLAVPTLSVDYTLTLPASLPGSTELLQVDPSGNISTTSGGGGGGSGTLAGDTDVNITSPTNGQSLTYDTASSKWINSTVSAGGTPSDLYVSTGTINVTNTTTETSIIGAGIGSMTLPAAFLVSGKAIRLKLYGYFSTDAVAPTLEVKVKVGSTVILDSTPVTVSPSLVNQLYELEALITCRTVGSSGSVFGQGRLFSIIPSAYNVPMSIGLENTGTSTVNTSTTELVDVTVQWGTASSNNTFYCTNVILSDADTSGSGGGGAPIVTSSTTLQTETLIQRITLGSDGPISFASIPNTFSHLKLRVVKIRSASATGFQNLGIYFNGDTSIANYVAIYSQGGNTVASNAAASNAYFGYAMGTASVTNYWTSGEGDIYNYAEPTSIKNFFARTQVPNSTSGWYIYQASVSNGYIGSGITQLDLFNSDAANFLAGSVVELIGITETSVVTGVTGGSLALPKRATLWGDECLVISGSWASAGGSHDNNENYSYYMYNGSNGNGDSLTNSFVIDTGTYTINILSLIQNDCGKVDVSIDGSVVVTVDPYTSGSLTYNQILTIPGVVMSSGYHKIQFTINGSSGSNHHFYLTKAFITPSAD